MVWFKRALLVILLLAFAGASLLFTLRNQALVNIDLLFIYLPSVKIELALVLSFILGALFSLLLCSVWVLKMRRKMKQKYTANATE